MKETVLQFGTGNFLRAFADDFLDRMNRAGLYDGKAVIVSPTDSPRVDALNARNCRYRLLLRGIENGERTETVREIGSVSRAINPYRDHGAFLALAGNPDLRVIVSNTTEAGIAYDPSCKKDDAPPAAFPAKLARFLYERYTLGLPGFLILPCELIDDNAGLLRAYVEKYAAQWALPEAFLAWLRSENTFCNTLVDRIVTGFPAGTALGETDPIAVAAEPYCLWAIEGDHEAEFPLRAAGINAVWTSDVKRYKTIKVRILNGLHTSMVFPGLLAGKETVADCMADPAIRAYLERLLHKEILPAIPDADAAGAFANAVIPRFENLFLNHRLASIALNSVSKYRARVVPTLLDRREQTGKTSRAFALSLSCLLEYYKTHDAADDARAVESVRARPLGGLLGDETLWGADLAFMAGDVAACTEILRADGVKEAIAWSVS